MTDAQEPRQRRRPPDSGAPRWPGDGRGLVGLMMIRGEDDVLEEALHNHARFCHAIFVLDGSEGQSQRRSREIAAACPVVR
jgi:hypothetical protein